MELRGKIEQFSTSPGVYLMKDAGGKVIYVGKAINLKSRVKSYFSKEALGRYQIQFLLKRVVSIDTLLCSNEKEALLLENSLIKKHRPRYNISLKDDKSYVSLKLSLNHSFPALTVTRRIKKDGALYFGPYSSATACRETVDFIYRNFQLRTCSDSEIKNRARPCLEYQIHRCQAPCVGYINEANYAKQIERVKLFLEGKDDELIKEVRAKMEEASIKEDFEGAARFRDLLKNIQMTLEKQSVIRHAGAHRDLVCLYRPGKKGIVALLHFRGGALVDSRYYTVGGLEDDDTLMENFLTQYYLGAVFIPDEILASHSFEGAASLSELLSERKGKKVLIVSPQKGEKKEMLALAARNAEAEYARVVKKEFQLQEALEAVQAAFGVANFPHRIECYDVSNISGKMATASRVVFVEGEPDKKEYRHYRIRSGDEPNDYAMLKEVMERRAKTSESLPDLMLVDGGKGQLNAALKALQDTGMGTVPVVGIAKGKGPGARAKGLWKEKKEEEFYLPHRKNPLVLKRGSAELMLLQRLRDEAHRFAIRYHRKLRDDIKR